MLLLASPREMEISFLNSLIKPIPDVYYGCLYGSFLLTIIFAIYYSRKKVILSFGSNNDAWSQLFMAINTLGYKSLSPMFKNYFDGEKGYFHYPLGFFWFTGLITRIYTKKSSINELKSKDKFINIFPNMDPDEADIIDNFIANLHKLSGIYFPIAIICLAATSFYIVLPHTVLNLISITCGIILIDAMMSREYSIATRNIGLMGLGFCITGLFIYTLVPVYCQSAYNSWIAGNLFYEWSVSIIWTISLLMILQFSQRGSQLFISLSISTCLIYTAIASKVAIGIAMGIIISIQIPSLNTLEHIKTHVFNRINESRWILRTYGEYRYSLFKGLNNFALKQFIKDLLQYDFMKTGLEASYFKKNFLTSFAIYRAYLYLMILLSCCSMMAEDNVVLIGKILLCAGVFPSLLVFWRPLQGYGDGSLYLQGIYPYAFIATGSLLYECLSNSSIFLNSSNLLQTLIYSISVLFIYDAIIIAFKFQGLNNLVTKQDLSDSIARFPDNKIKNIVKFLDAITAKCAGDTQAPIRIMSYEVHSCGFIDTLESYINKQPNKLKVNSFKLIDNSKGGYYDYWRGWCFDHNILVNSLKPDLLLLDLEKPNDISLIKALLNSKVYNNSLVFRDSNLAFVSLSGRFKSKNHAGLEA